MTSIHALDVRSRFLQGLRICDSAAAVVDVDERGRFACEQVAGVCDAQRREDDDAVAVGVTGAEVVEVDPVVTAN